jgi:hypothetical protein
VPCCRISAKSTAYAFHVGEKSPVAWSKLRKTICRPAGCRPQRMTKCFRVPGHIFCGKSRGCDGGTMDALLTALARLARGQFYVPKPTTKGHRLNKIVKCPETDQTAKIRLSAHPVSKLEQKPAIKKCTLWPSRDHCSQGCLRQAATDPKTSLGHKKRRSLQQLR